MQEWDSLDKEKILANGDVLVVGKNELWDLDGSESWHVLSIVLRHLSFQCGRVGAVDGNGSFHIVCCDGAVVDEVVCEYVFEMLLGRSSKFGI
jgi:hypothetical protein